MESVAFLLGNACLLASLIVSFALAGRACIETVGCAYTNPLGLSRTGIVALSYFQAIACIVFVVEMCAMIYFRATATDETDVVMGA